MKFVGTILVVSLFASVGFAGHAKHQELDYLESPCPGFYAIRARDLQRMQSAAYVLSNPQLADF